MTARPHQHPEPMPFDTVKLHRGPFHGRRMKTLRAADARLFLKVGTAKKAQR